MDDVSTRRPLLIVDDDAASLQLAQAVLQAEGYETRTATDAVSALEELKSCIPAAIVLDLRLPGIDGLASLP